MLKKISSFMHNIKHKIACKMMINGIEYQDKSKNVLLALHLGINPNARLESLYLERRASAQLQHLTIVERCARLGNVCALEHLIAFGANLGAIDNDWVQPSYCFEKHCYYPKEEPLENGKIELNGSGRWLALHHAVAKGQLQAVKLLSKHTPGGTNACTQNGWTPLFIAIREQRYDVCAWLLEQGADPNVCIDGRPLLVFCAYKKDEKALQLLLKAGANPDACDTKNASALHALAQISAPNELVLLLLNARARLDIQCIYGKTAPQRALAQDCHRLYSLMEQHAFEQLIPLQSTSKIDTTNSSQKHKYL